MSKPPEQKLSAKRGRPRAEDVGTTLSDLRPWLNDGVSRTTWYRRRREAALQAKPVEKTSLKAMVAGWFRRRS